MKDQYEIQELRESVDRELAENRQLYEDDILLAIRSCSENVYAKRFMYEIFKWCGVFSSAIPDEEKLAHAEGRRLIGLLVKGKLDELNSELFYEIMKEGTRYEESICKTRTLSAKLKQS